MTGPTPAPTREECLNRAAEILARACARRDSLTPEQAAREAHRPGGMSLEERIALIRRQRAQAQTPQAA